MIICRVLSPPHGVGVFVGHCHCRVLQSSPRRFRLSSDVQLNYQQQQPTNSYKPSLSLGEYSNFTDIYFIYRSVY